MSTTPITISLSDLTANKVPTTTLENAFGPSSLGIIIISNLPPHFTHLRHKLLSYASHLAHLSPSTLSTLTSPQSKYLVGWSHGRETLPPKSLPDFHKGSYYVNCAFYQDPALDAAPATPLFPDFPEYTSDNVWPGEDVLPGFRETVQEVCGLVIDVAALVARSIDRYAEVQIEGYAARNEGVGYLEGVVRGSYTTKARLLHYFPPSEQTAATNGSSDEDASNDDWCATHVDHGCLTGLLSAMYLRHTPTLPALPALPEAIPCPDPTAGLYIRSRTGEAVRVTFPADCLAFQTGEALEKITGGRFRAVPHYVSPGKDVEAMDGVERNTLAVFTQPNLEDVVDRESGECFGGFARGVVGRNTVKG